MEIKNNSKTKVNKGLSILNSIGDDDVAVKEINIDLIDFNDKNFYGQNDDPEDIKELAESIKEIGTLIHDIVVKPNDNGRYTLISGEKRTKAYRFLYEESKDKKWENIPCKIMDDIKNDVEEEIILIRANRDVRERSETIKAKEVERLEALYEQKKLSGEKVGLIRKRVADDLGISESMVHRYKKVNELIPELKAMLDNNEIGLSTVTDFIADKPESEQKLFYEFISNFGKKVSRDEAKLISEKMQTTIDTLQSTNDKLLNQLNNEKNQYQEELNSLKTVQNDLEGKIKELEESKDNKSTEEIEEINNELEVLRGKYSDAEKENESLKKNIENNDKAKDELIAKLKAESKKQKKGNTEDSIEELKSDVEINVYINNAYNSIKSMTEVIQLNSDNKKLSEPNKKLLNQIKELVNTLLPDK